MLKYVKVVNKVDYNIFLLYICTIIKKHVKMKFEITRRLLREEFDRLPEDDERLTEIIDEARELGFVILAMEMENDLAL